MFKELVTICYQLRHISLRYAVQGIGTLCVWYSINCCADISASTTTMVPLYLLCIVNAYLTASFSESNIFSSPSSIRCSKINFLIISFQYLPVYLGERHIYNYFVPSLTYKRGSWDGEEIHHYRRYNYLCNILSQHEDYIL